MVVALSAAYRGLDVRQVIVTPDNRGPQINVVAWTAMVVMILAVGTRLAIKYNAFRSFGWDDGLVTVAMVLAVGQAAAVSMQVANGGLGQRLSSLNSAEVTAFEHGQYASDMLYVGALCFSKISSLAYILQVTPDSGHRMWGRVILLAVLVWTVFALFGIAFECRLPNPWAIVTEKCIKINVLWDVIGALDIVTDIALISLPTYIVWNLQMIRSRRAWISVAFVCRIILFPIIILRLHYLTSAFHSSDKTFDYRDTVFTTLADVNASILVACIPFLKPFMRGLDSGLLTSDLRVRGPKTSIFANISSAKEGGSGGKGNSYQLKKISAKMAIDSGLGRLHTDRIQHQVNIAHDPPQHDFESRTSAGSDRMIIKRTTEWNVNYDRSERGNSDA